MTIKQQKYLEGVIEGKSKKQSALEAGYSENTALTVSQNIESEAFRDEMEKAMEESGLTNSQIMSKLKEGLEAIVLNTPSWRDENFPNYEVRFKYLMLALRLKKLL